MPKARSSGTLTDGLLSAVNLSNMLNRSINIPSMAFPVASGVNLRH